MFTISRFGNAGIFSLSTLKLDIIVIFSKMSSKLPDKYISSFAILKLDCDLTKVDEKPKANSDNSKSVLILDKDPTSK